MRRCSPYGNTICIIRINKCIVHGQQCWIIEVFFYLYKIPIPRDILPLMWVIFISKVAVHHYSQKLGMVDILIFSLSTTRSLSMWIFPLRFLNIMKWVFFKFKDNLLMFNQSIIFFISFFICSITLSGHLPERNRFESSAKRRRNKTSETLDRSLIYNRNNNGPRMDPWGTPHVTFLRLELVSL